MLTVTTKKIAEQSGRSMIEMLGVLSVIAILSIGGLLGYSQAVKKYRFNETASQITQIMNNVRTQFPNQSRARQLSMKQAIDLGLIPEKMIDTSGTGATNPFQGTVTLESATIDGKDVYKLTLDGLPDDVAMQLGSSSLGSKGNVVNLMINGSKVN